MKLKSLGEKKEFGKQQRKKIKSSRWAEIIKIRVKINEIEKKHYHLPTKNNTKNQI